MQLTTCICITHFVVALLSDSLACTLAGQCVRKQGLFIDHAANPKGQLTKVPEVPLQLSLRK